MKIKRFNSIIESANVIYDMPWTKEKFQELEALKGEIKATEESLFEPLSDFLMIHRDLIDDGDIDEEYGPSIASFYYSNNKRCNLVIYYTDSDNDEYTVELDSKQFKDFLDFLKDPDLYKNTKKFNL